MSVLEFLNGFLNRDALAYKKRVLISICHEQISRNQPLLAILGSINPKANPVVDEIILNLTNNF
jgi:hypothetical protein